MYSISKTQYACSVCQAPRSLARVTPQPLSTDKWFDLSSPNQRYVCHECRAEEATRLVHLERRKSAFEADRKSSLGDVPSSRVSILRGNDPSDGRSDGKLLCLSCKEEIRPKEQKLFLQGDSESRDSFLKKDKKYTRFSTVTIPGIRRYCARCLPREGLKVATTAYCYEPEGIHGILPNLWGHKWTFRDSLLSNRVSGLLRYARTDPYGRQLISHLFQSNEDYPPRGFLYKLPRPGLTPQTKETSLISRYLTPDEHDFDEKVSEFFLRCLMGFEDCDPEYLLFFMFSPRFLTEEMYKALYSRLLIECLTLANQPISPLLMKTAEAENWETMQDYLRPIEVYKEEMYGIPDGHEVGEIVKMRVLPAATHPDPWYASSLLANSLAFLHALIRDSETSLKGALGYVARVVREAVDANKAFRYNVKYEYLPMYRDDEGLHLEEKTRGAKKLLIPLTNIEAPDERMSPEYRTRTCRICQQTLHEMTNFPSLGISYKKTDDRCFSCIIEHRGHAIPVGPTQCLANPRKFAAYIQFMEKVTDGQFVFPEDGHKDTPLCGHCRYKDFSANCLDCLMMNYIMTNHRNQSGMPLRRTDYIAYYFMHNIEFVPGYLKKSRGESHGVIKGTGVTYQDLAHINKGRWWETAPELIGQITGLYHQYLRGVHQTAALEFLSLGFSLPEPILDSMFLLLFKELLRKNPGTKAFETTTVVGRALDKIRDLRQKALYAQNDAQEVCFQELAKSERNRMRAVAEVAFQEKLHTLQNGIGVVVRQLLRGPGPNPDTMSTAQFVVQDSWHLLMVVLGEFLRIANYDGKWKDAACEYALDVLGPALIEAREFSSMWRLYSGKEYHDLDWKRTMALIENPELLSPSRLGAMTPREIAERKGYFDKLLEQNRLLSFPDTKPRPILFPRIVEGGTPSNQPEISLSLPSRPPTIDVNQPANLV